MIAACAAVAAAGCTGGAAARVANISLTRSVPLAGAAQACGGLPSFPRGYADEIMAGRLTISPWPAVTIDPHRDGHIDWSMNPFHHPTWQQDFQSGGWIESLIEAYLAGGPNANAYRARAKALLTGWLAQVPQRNRDPETVICSSEAFPGESWINTQIPPAVNYLATHWQGAWNHGLKQDLELLHIGCGYPPGAFGGQALGWRRTAYRQMIASFAPNRLGPAVDVQGATNEEATGYADFTYGLWTYAERQLAACGYSLPGTITSRISLMPMFLALATQPDGKLVQIGDTYVQPPRHWVAGTPLQYAATLGRAGRPPAQRVGIYQAGYVFGRSGWGTAATFGRQSFYSLRFGGGRQIHGHDDHMSLTYYARGRNLLVNAGHTGYENTPYRAFLISPEAGNVLVMPGTHFYAGVRTSLTRQSIRPTGQFFEFSDTAYGKHPRERSVYISQRPDLVLVFDRASGAASYQQLWHLDPALTVTRVTGSSAVAKAPGAQLYIGQVPLPGQVIPSGSTRVVIGQTRPYQGWVSHQMLQRIPAPVITMTRTGRSAAMLTLIAPSAPGTTVTTAITPRPRGWYRLTVHLGRTPVSFLIGPTGYIEPA